MLSTSNLTGLLARLATEDTYVFLETTRPTAEEYHSLLFLHPIDRLIHRTDDDPEALFLKAEDFIGQGYYLAGWFAYDFGYQLEPVLRPNLANLAPAGTVLADFGVFTSPHIYDHRTEKFIGPAGPWPTTNVADPGDRPDYGIAGLKTGISRADYLANVKRIKRYIESGDTYQVNYTLKLLFDFTGRPEALYQELRRNQSVSYAALIKDSTRHIISLSPELFFKIQGDRCLVRPMKGTAGRGRTSEEDSILAAALRADSKNRSENIMIVDLLRNDLGHICRAGAVEASQLFTIERYETVHQMTSTIQGTLRPDIRLRDIFRALFPSGSVTGAPKIRTMEIIAELEQERRDVYTGAIGYLSPAGKAVFNVPIRTVVIADCRGTMGIGSGIVHDSDPEKEWQECLLKGRFLTDPAPNFELFETLIWRRGSGYWRLDLHMIRLEDSARYFFFSFNRETVLAALHARAQAFAAGEKAYRVRIALAKDGALDINAFPLPLSAPIFEPPWPPVATPDPPTAIWSRNRTDSGAPHLYHKTTLRTFYDQERSKAVAAGHSEVLFTNERGEVTEGSISNLFIGRDGILYTPPVRCGLLNGVLRRHLLERLGEGIREKIISKEETAEADVIYVGNSVRGLVRVRLVDAT